MHLLLLSSLIGIYDITSEERRMALTENVHFEAPNWNTDGNCFIINEEGLLYRISLDGKDKRLIPTGNLKNLNNDYGLSSDGKTLAVSSNDVI